MSLHPIIDGLHHLRHDAPAQRPLRDFIHHNTLHAREHGRFDDAVTAAAAWPPHERVRATWARGAFTLDDLAAARADVSPDRSAPPWASWPEIDRALLTVDARPTTSHRARVTVDDPVDGPLLRALCAAIGASLPDDACPPPDEADAVAAATDQVRDALDGLDRAGTPARLVDALAGLDLTGRANRWWIARAAAWLDAGVAPLRAPPGVGPFTAWRDHHPEGALVGGARLSIPEDPVEAIAALYVAQGAPARAWGGWIEAWGARLPGWIGMVHQREHRGGPAMEQAIAAWAWREAELAEGSTAARLGVVPTVPALAGLLRAEPSRNALRLELAAGRLPEPLAEAVRRLDRAPRRPPGDPGWRELVVAWWQHASGPRGDAGPNPRAHRDVWPLFVLARALGVTPAQAGADGVAALCAVLPARVASLYGPVVMRAHERALARAVRSGVAAPTPPGRPAATVLVCIDDREESLRRHLEAQGPVETFGVAGFFGVAIRHRPLGALVADDLCPPALTPAWTVDAYGATPADDARAARLAARGRRLADLEDQGRTNPLIGAAAAWLGVVPKLTTALADAFAPGWRRAPTPPASRLHRTVDPARPERGGLTLDEQAERVASLLQTAGARASDLAPLVLVLGHGGSTVNNPHRGAYACGACGGRSGGPNARLVAEMANDPAVRGLLVAQGVTLPPDTVFVGGQHDTTVDEVTLYGAPDLGPVAGWLEAALGANAVERARRFASAPSGGPDRVRPHVRQRAADPFEPRAELGHASCALAIVGPRRRTRGVDLDRRAFLVSYAPDADPDGAVLTRLLGAVVPVCAGISLEYWFSSAAPDRFGAGTKLPHNPMGGLSVMEGTEGDLRTGLPLQMTELHDPVRLQIWVDAPPERLERCVAALPDVARLVDHGWIRLEVGP